MTDPLSTISTRRTPQDRQASPAQVKNTAGGYVFEADPMARLRRFLAMGVEGGTYYATEQQVTIAASEHLLALIRDRPSEVLDILVDMSERGASVKQHPIMFTLAALSGAEDPSVRTAALSHLSAVARTASHLFLFASYVEQFRGWGKGLRRAVARWYTDCSTDRLAYQIEKYGSRYGFTHRDLLRLAHVGSEQSKSATEDPVRKALYAHAADNASFADRGRLPEVSRFAIRMASTASTAEVVREIRSAQSVSWEMIPTEHLGKSEVWEALLDGGHVPIGALLRNLGRLTANGTFDPFGQDDRTARQIGRLIDPEVLVKGRIHPMSVLLAAATYRAGRGVRGSTTWHPIMNIERVLDTAFMASFPTIEPDNSKTVLIGLDVSGSMDTATCAGLPLSARDAAAALGMALAAQFPRNMGVAFTGESRAPGGARRNWSDITNTLTPINLDPQRRLVDLVAEAKSLPFGRTDCALPITYAMERGLAVDAFVILTDNETWTGDIHPHQALRAYREKTGINARMVSVSMQHNNYTIADPGDPRMLDVVGLDSGVVSVVSDFIAGRS